MISGKCIVADIWVCPIPKCYHERLVLQEWNLNPLKGLSKKNYLDYITFFGINKLYIFTAQFTLFVPCCVTIVSYLFFLT